MRHGVADGSVGLGAVSALRRHRAFRRGHGRRALRLRGRLLVSSSCSEYLPVGVSLATSLAKRDLTPLALAARWIVAAAAASYRSVADRIVAGDRERAGCTGLHRAPAQPARDRCRLVVLCGELAGDTALGTAGFLDRRSAKGRATVAYTVALRQASRGRGHGASGVTAFGWTLSDLFRIELYVERSNVGLVRTAGAVGYVREGLLRSHQPIRRPAS
jgi:RimJ/RimL family protein N-acetyltransferase